MLLGGEGKNNLSECGFHTCDWLCEPVEGGDTEQLSVRDSRTVSLSSIDLINYFKAEMLLSVFYGYVQSHQWPLM